MLSIRQKELIITRESSGIASICNVDISRSVDRRYMKDNILSVT